jgi:hypothetical protein
MVLEITGISLEQQRNDRTQEVSWIFRVRNKNSRAPVKNMPDPQEKRGDTAIMGGIPRTRSQCKREILLGIIREMLRQKETDGVKERAQAALLTAKVGVQMRGTRRKKVMELTYNTEAEAGLRGDRWSQPLVPQHTQDTKRISSLHRAILATEAIQRARTHTVSTARQIRRSQWVLGIRQAVSGAPTPRAVRHGTPSTRAIETGRASRGRAGPANVTMGRAMRTGRFGAINAGRRRAR